MVTSFPDPDSIPDLCPVAVPYLSHLTARRFLDDSLVSVPRRERWIIACIT